MHKDSYEKLIKRFALELAEVGVTDDMIKIIQAQIARSPNLSSCSSDETTDCFTYRHNGYMIEARRTVNLVVKKCK